MNTVKLSLIKIKTIFFASVLISLSQGVVAQEEPGKPTQKYIMEFSCKGNLLDESILLTEGHFDITSYEGSVSSVLVDPMTGMSNRALRVKLSAKNLNLVNSENSSFYFINEYINRPRLDFILKMPIDVNDKMISLLIDGETAQLLCQKNLITVESF